MNIELFMLISHVLLLNSIPVGSNLQMFELFVEHH